MWLALALVLTQAEPQPTAASVEPQAEQPEDGRGSSPLNEPLESTTEEPVNVRGGKPGLFSQPRTTPGVLVGRIFLGFLGTVGGAAPGMALLGAGALVGGFSSGIGVPVAILGGLLAAGGAVLMGALGASANGRNRGADYVDALVVLSVVLVVGAALAGGLFAVVAAATGSVYSLAAYTALIAGGVGLATYFMAPVIVQLAKKPDGPQPTVTLAAF